MGEMFLNCVYQYFFALVDNIIMHVEVLFGTLWFHASLI